MAAVLDKRKVGATGNILASRDTSSPAPATQSDVMDKAELYKDQKIVKDGHLSTRNTKTSQPTVATDHTDKADLYKEMNDVAASPASTNNNNSNQKDSSTPRTPRYPAIYEPLPKEPKPNAPQQTVPQEIPQVNTTLGGLTPDAVEQWLKDQKYMYLSPTSGWNNGLGVDGNVRSMSNYIRQQMDKNTMDWHKADAATKDYLHQNNVELEKLLQKYAGGVESVYDPVSGRWSTNNSDLGYGWDSGMGPYEDYIKYDVTEEMYNNAKYGTGHYYNMVDKRAIPNPVAEEDGYSGRYAPYAYGLIQQYLTRGTAGSGQPIHYDAVGDGYMDEYSLENSVRDANGNVTYLDDYIKPGIFASGYTQQFAPTIENGVIQPGILSQAHPGGWVEGESRPVNRGGTTGGGYVASSQRGGGSSNGGYSDMLEQMYGEALKAQLAQLESSYKQNVSDLDASSVKADANYNEQKRQTDGTAAQNAANWKEMANAYGLNSGAIGQAALAQNNQRQSDLNTLGAAQAQAQAEIERQRTLLGQQYQLQINQAIAENNQQKAQALYQEAVRMDEVLRQEQQNNANLMLQYAQMAMQQQQYNSDLALQYAKLAGSSGGPKAEQVIMTPDYTAAYQAALDSGNAYNYLDSIDYLKQYGIKSTDGLASGYDKWYSNLTNQAARDAAQLATQNSTRDGDFLARALSSKYSIDTIGDALDLLGIK